MHTSQSNQRTAVVTGATGSIGGAIVRGLASRGFSLVLVGRSPVKASALIEQIASETGNQHLLFLEADLSRQEAIRKAASAWTGPVDILINNAAAAPVKRLETPEGIELQFATNVLGYFWMIQSFSRHLAKGSGSRVVNVASYWAGGLDLADLEFTQRPYDNHAAYRQSKQANRMLTPVFAKQLLPHGITVNSCHPGDVNSVLSNDLGFGGSQSPDQGAATPLWLATSPDVAGITGSYFEHRKEVPCRYSSDIPAAERLYDLCVTYTH